MNPQLLIAGIIAAIGFWGGWHVQTVRYTAKEAEHAKQELAQVQLTAATTIRRMDNVIDAQRAATAREVALRRDRDSAYSALERLRDTLARNVPRTDDAAGTCVERTDPARELFLDCAAALVEMGGRADRHANDAQTLIQAWPK